MFYSSVLEEKIYYIHKSWIGNSCKKIPENFKIWKPLKNQNPTYFELDLKSVMLNIFIKFWENVNFKKSAKLDSFSLV